MKVKLFITLAGAIFLIHACSESFNNSSTSLDSHEISSRLDRVNTLRAEIKAPTDFYDAEFQLFNVNGFSNSRISVPGASSWDYKFVVKLNMADISPWLEGFEEMSRAEYDQSWTNDLTKHMPERWSRSDSPEMYKRPGQDVVIILYRSEGILFKRVINL
ncbi:MAG: hypothetical protein AAFP70_00200 [Calditrichota bacterium]